MVTRTPGTPAPPCPPAPDRGLSEHAQMQYQLEAVEKALQRAFTLGQIYWSQAEFDVFEKRSEATRQKFLDLKQETLALLKKEGKS